MRFWTEIVQGGATAIADIVVFKTAGGTRYQEILQLLAVIRVVQLIETGIRLRVAVDNLIRKIGDPLIFVLQHPVIKHDRAIVQIMLQGGGDLPADVGRILRITYTIGYAVKAAKASVPSVDDLAADEPTHPSDSFCPVRDPNHPSG